MEIKKIRSFEVDHTKLLPGLYVSRKDVFGGEVFTTFDLRLRRPNIEEHISPHSSHSIEHLFATYIRNCEKLGEKVVYFGPMGCLTGFYLILHGDYTPYDIKDELLSVIELIAKHNGPIPGRSVVECGNAYMHNMYDAVLECERYAEVLKSLSKENTEYNS